MGRQALNLSQTHRLITKVTEEEVGETVQNYLIVLGRRAGYLIDVLCCQECKSGLTTLGLWISEDTEQTDTSNNSHLKIKSHWIYLFLFLFCCGRDQFNPECGVCWCLSPKAFYTIGTMTATFGVEAASQSASELGGTKSTS